MTDPFEKHRTDTLILLVGGNPLPNYVAAHLLSHPQSQLVLIHSEGTKDQARRIEQVLRDEGRMQSELKNVNESDPASIDDAVKDAAKKYSSGSIGLNYTGGTKAMAVHAYRALEQTDRQAIFSYLDARSLSMVISGQRTPIKINQQVRVPLETLLKLHEIENFSLIRDITPWENIREELFRIKQSGGADWDNWRRTYLNQKDKESLTDFQNRLAGLSVKDFPEDVQSALQKDGIACSSTLNDLVQSLTGVASSSLSSVADIAKWFNATWFEEYVFSLVSKLASITDHAMSIQTMNSRGKNFFEFDVGFMRGHQFYGISVTTMNKKTSAKEKLLEAIVRTEQLGGGEARCALVCWVEPSEITALKQETDGLFDREHILILGKHDLPKLENHLKQWIKRS